ncbi:MAG: hypothetical protein ACKPKK_18420 [Dolichospermum sp.]
MFPVPCSLFPVPYVPYSLFVPCSLFPMFPIPCSLFPMFPIPCSLVITTIFNANLLIC